jgi:hypothetical protein
MFEFLKHKGPPVSAATDDEQEQHDSKLLKALYSWVMVLLGLSVLLSVQFPFFQVTHQRSGVFIEELAFALILAGLFSLTVEKYHREEFRKFVLIERRKLKRDVFLYAYGHAIAEQTRQEIKDHILDCPFQRDRVRLEWTFTPVEGETNKIRVAKTFSYTQRNGTKLPQKVTYKMHQNTTNTVLAQVAGTPSVTIRHNGRIVTPTRAPGEHKDKTALDLELTEELKPDEEIEVSLAVSEKRELTGDDSYSSRHPIVGLTFVTARVEGGLNLAVAAYCKSAPLGRRIEDNPPHTYAFEIRDGILPFQGIMLSWSPRDPQAPEVGQGATAVAVGETGRNTPTVGGEAVPGKTEPSVARVQKTAESSPTNGSQGAVDAPKSDGT